ncbi:hypothetical protein [Mycobacterium sp.]|uniref:hypothetical protein n=1 Tax=Mycobacterium sp. TaxID=1785 RepID=UPI0031D8C7B7
MLIISLVLAVIGLAALVFAVITSNEMVAWVCIGASVLGVILLIVDALQERQRRETGSGAPDSPTHDDHDDEAADYPADAVEDADGAAADSVGDGHSNS